MESPAVADESSETSGSVPSIADDRDDDEPEDVEVDESAAEPAEDVVEETLELSEDDMKSGADDLFTGVDDVDDGESDASDQEADGDDVDQEDGEDDSSLGDIADGLDGNAEGMEEAINDGMARMATIGLTEEKMADSDLSKDDLETEFAETFQAFRCGYFGTRVVEEYVLDPADGDVSPMWGLLGTTIMALTMAVWLRPDGDELVQSAREAVEGLAGGDR